MMRIRFAAFAAAFFLALPSRGAGVERIAVIVGSNQGLASEQPLRYATRDATQLAGLLRRGKAFEKERIYLLCDSDAERVKAALEEVAGRVLEIRRGGRQSLILFYFSGHGGDDALHIKGKALSRSDILGWFERVQSDIRIMILDACESGDFLRSKGIKALEDDPIVLADSLRSRGSIILSASSRGEKAQESEDYRGAVFTHHLVNGLDGIADYNGDRAVSLMEAFDYARIATRLERIAGSEGAQNPSFDFDLVGESDPILANLAGDLNRVTFRGIPAGRLEICDASNFGFVNRAQMTGRDSVDLALPPGKYLFAYSLGDAHYVASADLTWGKRVVLSSGDFRKRPKPPAQAKGAEAWGWRPHGFELQGLELRLGGRIPAAGVRVAYSSRGTGRSYSLAIAAGRGDQGDASFDYAYRFLRGEGGMDWELFSFRYGRILAGATAGMSHVWGERTDLRFPAGPVETGAGDLPIRIRSQSNLFHAGLPAKINFFLPLRVRLACGVAYTQSVFQEYDGGSWLFEPDWEPFAGIGFDL